MLCTAAWGRCFVADPQTSFRIEEVQVGAAVCKIGEVTCRGLPFGGRKGGFDGVERVKI